MIICLAAKKGDVLNEVTSPFRLVVSVKVNLWPLKSSWDALLGLLNHHGLQAQAAVVLIVVVLYAYAVLLPLGGVDSCHT